MIDWHTHILPYMDDGSNSLEESAQMLKVCREEGVKAVVLSSHFYPHREDPESFLGRRERALAKLTDYLAKIDPTPHDSQTAEAPWPQLVPAAEVYYFNELARLDEDLLKQLAVGDSKHIIVELPERALPAELFEVLESLIFDRAMIPVLAHIDRYFHLIKDYGPFARLVDEGMRIQLNAEALDFVFSKRKALKLIKKGLVHMVTSDCHNLTDRPPGLFLAGQALKGQEHLFNYPLL